MSSLLVSGAEYIDLSNITKYMQAGEFLYPGKYPNIFGPSAVHKATVSCLYLEEIRYSQSHSYCKFVVCVEYMCPSWNKFYLNYILNHTLGIPAYMDILNTGYAAYLGMHRQLFATLATFVE